MPVWLVRFLPHIGLALALGFAIWWIYSSGQAAEKRARDLQDAKAAVALAKMEQRLSQKISEGLSYLDKATAERLGEIDITEKTVVMPTVTREIQREARLSNPSAGLTPGLLEAVNSARRASANRPTPAGVSK